MHGDTSHLRKRGSQNQPNPGRVVVAASLPRHSRGSEEARLPNATEPVPGER